MEKFNCAYDELVDVDKLVPNPKNPNKHPKEQIERLAKIIDFQGQRQAIVVSNRSGFIVKGHGKLEAIKKLGWEKCAVDYQDYESEAQEYADMVADNEIAKWASTDDDLVREEVKKLDIDLDFLGYMDFSVEEEKKDETYTTKTDIPQYEVKGDDVGIKELVETDRMDALIDEIEKSNVSSEEKEFLKISAYRHNVFNYSKIADYYAKASPEMQRMMENSALVLIDIEDALKNGYTELSEKIGKVFEADNEK